MTYQRIELTYYYVHQTEVVYEELWIFWWITVLLFLQAKLNSDTQLALCYQNVIRNGMWRHTFHVQYESENVQFISDIWQNSVLSSSQNCAYAAD